MNGSRDEYLSRRCHSSSGAQEQSKASVKISTWAKASHSGNQFLSDPINRGALAKPSTRLTSCAFVILQRDINHQCSANIKLSDRSIIDSLHAL